MENREFVTYRAFGAVGDGRTDDFAAIIKTHEYANEHRIPVRGDEGATYYLGKHKDTAEILTDVDWTGCAFIFDDREQPLEDRFIHFFHVGRTIPSMTLAELGVTRLEEGQTKLALCRPLPGDCYVSLTDRETRLFIREGRNQNNGTPQTDCFLLHPDGTVDPSTPIIWTFPQISESRVHPIEAEPLTIRGGTITTIANQQPSRYTYYYTNILIERSNVLVTGLKHYVEGEGDHGAPYDGIIQVNYCANVRVEDCLFTARKIYETIGSANLPVNMGSYDMRQRSAINVLYKNCTQTTDILDTKYWGIFVSDFCKNLRLENCIFSRFDAHMGVTNVTIRGCTLGHQCLNAIGHGLITVEDTTLYGGCLIALRGDYGATWKGDVVIKNCTWIPNRGQPVTRRNAMIGGHFSGKHDFGYECYMPQHVTVEGLHIQDASHEDDYDGIQLLGNIVPSYNAEENAPQYPYHATKTLTVSGITCDSGFACKPWTNPYLFRDTVFVDRDAK